MKKIIDKVKEFFREDMNICISSIFLLILEIVFCLSDTLFNRTLYISVLIPFTISIIARSLYYVWKEKDNYHRSKEELHSIVDYTIHTVQELDTDNKRLQLELDNLTEECVRLEGDCTELRKQIERYQKNISLDTIYTLYQFYLLIRKYNILDYTISLYPELTADVYCKMAVYTKMSINKEVIKNVRYHIEGTNVIL